MSLYGNENYDNCSQAWRSPRRLLFARNIIAFCLCVCVRACVRACVHAWCIHVPCVYMTDGRSCVRAVWVSGCARIKSSSECKIHELDKLWETVLSGGRCVPNKPIWICEFTICFFLNVIGGIFLFVPLQLLYRFDWVAHRGSGLFCHSVMYIFMQLHVCHTGSWHWRCLRISKTFFFAKTCISKSRKEIYREIHAHRKQITNLLHGFSRLFLRSI